MYAFLILLIIPLYFAYRYLRQQQLRASLLRKPLTGADRETIATQVPIVSKLPEHHRQALEGKVNLFLNQIDFIGCDGLEVTDEMRLSIAAQACLLVVNSDQWYDTLRTILVYPGAFKSLQNQQNGFVVSEVEAVRIGESWSRGPVVLSWAHTQHGALNEGDGKNVVFHEFAHQLDNLSGHTDGAPLMRRGQSFADWERTWVDAFESHTRDVERGRKTTLDSYGATAHEELFAVAVEMFFERPTVLREEEPEIYSQLSVLFDLEPHNWG